jgi:hypothetical protein
LKNILTSYQSEYKIVDHLYNEQARLVDIQPYFGNSPNKVLNLKK